jgi:hypothetical protein
MSDDSGARASATCTRGLAHLTSGGDRQVELGVDKRWCTHGSRERTHVASWLSPSDAPFPASQIDPMAPSTPSPCLFSFPSTLLVPLFCFFLQGVADRRSNRPYSDLPGFGDKDFKAQKKPRESAAAAHASPLAGPGGQAQARLGAG